MARHNVKVLVSDLVAERPSRSRLFEQLGIEYCCGGKRPLDEVCEEKGLDAQTLLNTLHAMESAGRVHDGERNWGRASAEELISNITEVHHAFLRAELPRLSALAEHVAESHGEQEPRLLLLRDSFEELRGEMEPHLDVEEEEVFRDILNLIGQLGPEEPVSTSEAERAKARLRSSLDSLEGEHRSTAEHLHRMEALSDRYEAPGWACNSFRAFYDGLRELAENIHEHVHKENNILFPAVRQALAR